jgi:hypothetical protein
VSIAAKEYSVKHIFLFFLFFFKKAYYQELYILIIEYSSVVTVAEWLDGSFESRPHLKDLDISKYKRIFSLEKP